MKRKLGLQSVSWGRRPTHTASLCYNPVGVVGVPRAMCQNSGLDNRYLRTSGKVSHLQMAFGADATSSSCSPDQNQPKQ